MQRSYIFIWNIRITSINLFKPARKLVSETADFTHYTTNTQRENKLCNSTKCISNTQIHRRITWTCVMVCTNTHVSIF